MSRRLSRSFGACLALGVTACATDQAKMTHPPPPQLVQDAIGTPLPAPPVSVSSPGPQPVATTARTPEPVGSLTLQQALSLALLGSPELAPYAIEIRAAEARILQADRPPNPDVEFLAEDFGGTGPAKRGFTGSQETLALGQVVELGSKRTKRVRLAHSEETLAAWDYEAKRLDVFVGTKRAFTDVLAAQRRLKLAEAALRLDRQLANAMAERARAGQVSPLEESRTQVLLSAAQVARDKAMRELQVARSRLAAFWGSSEPRFQEALGNLDDVTPIRPLPELLRLAADNPDLARWSAEIDQREARVALERAKNIPDPRITIGARRYGYGTGETAFVAGISIPLALTSINEGNLRDAVLQVNKGQALREQAVQQVAAGIVQTHERLLSAYDTVRAIRRSTLPAAETTFNGISTGYQEGKFTLLEVIDAQRALLDARAQLIDAEAAYQSAIADAERLTSQSPRLEPGRTREGAAP
ncbi:MAG: TolC family protein [Rhodopila sp.]